MHGKRQLSEYYASARADISDRGPVLVSDRFGVLISGFACCNSSVRASIVPRQARHMHPACSVGLQLAEARPSRDVFVIVRADNPISS